MTFGGYIKSGALVELHIETNQIERGCERNFSTERRQELHRKRKIQQRNEGQKNLVCACLSILTRVFEVVNEIILRNKTIAIFTNCKLRYFILLLITIYYCDYFIFQVILFNILSYYWSFLFIIAIYFIFKVISFNIFLYYYSLLFIHCNLFFCSKLFYYFPYVKVTQHYFLYNSFYLLSKLFYLMFLYIIAPYYLSLQYICRSKLFNLMLIYIIAYYYYILFYSSFQVNLIDVPSYYCLLLLLLLRYCLDNDILC